MNCSSLQHPIHHQKVCQHNLPEVRGLTYVRKWSLEVLVW